LTARASDNLILKEKAPVKEQRAIMLIAKNNVVKLTYKAEKKHF
jgi:hypothetical protein